jgi:ElaB/YqjD/DUF883 family membrane-anchored ribosome-binding protein
MKNTETEAAEAEQIVENAQELLSATANVSDTKVSAARDRLKNALQNSRELLDDLKDRAYAGAKVTDETIREYPYHSMGVALGVGVLLGFLIGRRSN